MRFQFFRCLSMWSQSLATKVLLNLSTCLLVCAWYSVVVISFVPIQIQSNAKNPNRNCGLLSAEIYLEFHKKQLNALAPLSPPEMQLLLLRVLLLYACCTGPQ